MKRRSTTRVRAFHVRGLVIFFALVAVEFLGTHAVMKVIQRNDIPLLDDQTQPSRKAQQESLHLDDKKASRFNVIANIKEHDNSSLQATLSDQDQTIVKKKRIRKLTSKKKTKTSTKFDSTGAAFIHLGKAAGSTLSLQLRNGCHSFVPKPCHKVKNETIVSEMVTDYYHTPDVDKIPKSKHGTYFVTARDPMERLVSAFVYLHPENRRARNEWGRGVETKSNKQAYECFPTLEDFAQAVGKKDHSLCSAHARKAVDGRIPIMNHLWGNYKRMVAPLHPEARIYVFRNEHIWEDWIAVNTMLASNRTVVLPSGKKARHRDMKKVEQPVSRDLSDEGRAHLCHAIQQEYEVYLSLLNRAENLNAKDIQEARDVAHKHCPNLVAKRVSLTSLRGGSGGSVVKRKDA